MNRDEIASTDNTPKCLSETITLPELKAFRGFSQQLTRPMELLQGQGSRERDKATMGHMIDKLLVRNIGVAIYRACFRHWTPAILIDVRVLYTFYAGTVSTLPLNFEKRQIFLLMCQWRYYRPSPLFLSYGSLSFGS
jgi:hypothetical protein